VDIAGAVKQHKQLKHFSYHRQHGGRASLRRHPRIESDSAVEGQEGGEAEATAADEAAVTIIRGLHDLGQAVSERSILVEASLKEEVLHAREEPTQPRHEVLQHVKEKAQSAIASALKPPHSHTAGALSRCRPSQLLPYFLNHLSVVWWGLIHCSPMPQLRLQIRRLF
jgi:hypothetical protein